MKSRRVSHTAVAILAITAWVKSGVLPAEAQHTSELILCGWGGVSILDLSYDERPELMTEESVIDLNKEEENAPRLAWSWNAKDRKELPDYMKARYHAVDECKPVDGGHKVLITSSASGVALIERKSGKVSFYATVPNAHSAELLPQNRVAVAASHRDGAAGDRVVVFDLEVPAKEVCSDELPWGHGVVWDEERQILWALSNMDIRAYHLENWDSPTPSLARVATIELPERGGHDLYPIAGTELLVVSTGRHCWLFDRDKHRFKLHPILAEESSVKSIAYNPVTGQLAYIKADSGSSLSEKVRLLHPTRTLHFPGRHFYKARWNY